MFPFKFTNLRLWFIVCWVLIPSFVYASTITASRIGGHTTSVNVLGLASASPAADILIVKIVKPDGTVANNNALLGVTTATTLAPITQTGTWKVEASGSWDGVGWSYDTHSWSVTQ